MSNTYQKIPIIMLGSKHVYLCSCGVPTIEQDGICSICAARNESRVDCAKCTKEV